MTYKKKVDLLLKSSSKLNKKFIKGEESFHIKFSDGLYTVLLFSEHGYTIFGKYRNEDNAYKCLYKVLTFFYEYSHSIHLNN